MQNDFKNFLTFGSLGELTDIQDNPQLTVFIHYVSSDVTVKEEMLDFVALKETTHGVDIKNALDKTITNADVRLNKLVSVATDGTPAMGGKKLRLIALNDPRFPEFLPVHYIIHREHLAARYFKYEDVMKSVLEIVNFMRLNGKTRR
ncbi:Hypothetical predicted protein [Octopus vulgaris]|uniref:DUF4371 domain-containing protein n=1 Tax=Octopus vulgaris TaxID=6645 RepID=A0AA36ALW4_OCTVU|nr:Hypothetical predicted protein [Octopus vulgaris]